MTYNEFFKQSPEGIALMQSLDELIDEQHRKGEDEPELARDYMQRAKGIRAAISLINAKAAPKQEKKATRHR